MAIDNKTVHLTLSQNILGHLERRGVDKEDLGRVAGISDRDARMVLGGGGASAYILWRIAQGLHCRMDDLFGGVLDSDSVSRSDDIETMLRLLDRPELWSEVEEVASQALRSALGSLADGSTRLLLLAHQMAAKGRCSARNDNAPT